MSKFKSLFVKLACLAFAALTMVCFAADDGYVSLKKYISMNMYGDAYNEILRYEITRDEIDPALQKLRVDMLEETKRQMLKRAKTNSNDPAVYTILADIAFQQTDFDNAMMYVSKALNIKSGPLSNYVCAKIMFCQNNVDQAYNRMSYVLEGMPDSPVVFNDFQFLYNCKTYGKETATHLSHNTNFLRRATPAVVKKTNKAPKSPFQNDPTKVAVAIRQPKIVEEKPDFSDVEEDDFNLEDYDEELTIETSGKTAVAALPKDEKKQPAKKQDALKTVSKPIANDELGDFDTLDDFDNEFDFAQKEADKPKITITESANIEKKSGKSNKKDANDKNKIAAANLVEKAYNSFKEEDYQLARDQFNDAVKLYPEVDDPKGVKKKIDDHFAYYKKYTDALDYMETGSYQNAKPLFEEVYKYNPKMYSDVPFYLAQILGREEDPNREEMLKYLDAIINNKDTEAEMLKQAKYLKLQVLVDDEKYDEAKELLSEMDSKYGSWFKQQEREGELRQTINLHVWMVPISIGLAVLILSAIGIFGLGMMKRSVFAEKDYVEELKKAYGARNFTKAISVGEKAVSKGLPVQIEREILEMLVHIYFETNSFEKCKEAARRILKNFPENNTAWVFLTKTSVALNDTSNEAIKMYENMYKENPGNVEYLPLLAKHYIKEGNKTPEAFDIIYAYYKTTPNEKNDEVILALADGFVDTRTLSNEATSILEEANKIKEKPEYHELLARNYSKINRFDDAVKSCLFVLNKNIDNMGIHVVYTSSMKKLNRIPEAIFQYNKFLERHPNNPQLEEIIKGLEKDLKDVGNAANNELPSLDTLSDLPADSHFEASEVTGQKQLSENADGNTATVTEVPDLPEPELPAPGEGDFSIENFVEPPPEGFDPNSLPGEVPLPDFLKNNEEYADTEQSQKTEQDQIAGQPVEQSIEQPIEQQFEQLSAPQNSLPTFDDFQTVLANAKQSVDETPKQSSTLSVETNASSDWNGLEPAEREAMKPLELPEVELPTLDPFDLSSSLIDNLRQSEKSEDVSAITPVPPAPTNAQAEKLNSEQKLAQAQAAAAASKWDEVVYLLSNEYASNRNRDIGLLLIRARLEQKKPIMAFELVETLNLDPEMLPDNIKDIVYDIAVSLENEKKYKEALKLYDIICNVDINYKDAFDRSDKMYGLAKNA